MQELTDDNFDIVVKNSDRPVVVDFWATWCGPCRQLAPILESLAEEHPEVLFVKIDIDKCPETAEKYVVRSVPTLIVFQDGIPGVALIGAKPKRVLERELLQYINLTPVAG